MIGSSRTTPSHGNGVKLRHNGTVPIKLASRDTRAAITTSARNWTAEHPDVSDQPGLGSFDEGCFASRWSHLRVLLAERQHRSDEEQKLKVRD